MNPLAVVTGGTKGIGQAIVEKFLANGFDVVTCSRHSSNIDSLIRATANLQKNAQLMTIQADLSLKNGISAFNAKVVSLGRPVKVLVNNTGVFHPGSIASEEDGVFEDTINTNVASAYHVTRGLLQSLTNADDSHIINICSTASIAAYPNGGSYCISKFALYGMTKVLREELKPIGIKVTAILLGATLTDSWAGAGLPPERFIKTEDVAEAVWSATVLGSGVIEEILIRPQLGDIL